MRRYSGTRRALARPRGPGALATMSPLVPSAIEAALRVPGAPPAMAAIDPSPDASAESMIQAQLIGAETHKLTWFGIELTAIGALATVNVNAEPQRQVIPERLIVPANIAGNFLITQVNVGVESVFSSNAAIPAAVFTPDQTNSPFRAVLLRPGQRFTVGVQNLTNVEADFYAAVQARLA